MRLIGTTASILLFTTLFGFSSALQGETERTIQLIVEEEEVHYSLCHPKEQQKEGLSETTFCPHDLAKKSFEYFQNYVLGSDELTVKNYEERIAFLELNIERWETTLETLPLDSPRREILEEKIKQSIKEKNEATEKKNTTAHRLSIHTGLTDKLAEGKPVILQSSTEIEGVTPYKDFIDIFRWDVYQNHLTFAAESIDSQIIAASPFLNEAKAMVFLDRTDKGTLTIIGNDNVDETPYSSYSHYFSFGIKEPLLGKAAERKTLCGFMNTDHYKAANAILLLGHKGVPTMSRYNRFGHQYWSRKIEGLKSMRLGGLHCSKEKFIVFGSQKIEKDRRAWIHTFTLEEGKALSKWQSTDSHIRKIADVATTPSGLFATGEGFIDGKWISVLVQFNAQLEVKKMIPVPEPKAKVNFLVLAKDNVLVVSGQYKKGAWFATFDTSGKWLTSRILEEKQLRDLRVTSDQHLLALTQMGEGYEVEILNLNLKTIASKKVHQKSKNLMLTAALPIRSRSFLTAGQKRQSSWVEGEYYLGPFASKQWF